MAGGRRLRALGWVQAALERGRGDLPVAGLGVGRASHEHAKSPRRKKGQDLLLQLNRRQRDFGFQRVRLLLRRRPFEGRQRRALENQAFEAVLAAFKTVWGGGRRPGNLV